MASDAGGNRPDRIASVFGQYRDEFPFYPLGTEMTDAEQALVEALGWLQRETSTPGKRVATLLRALTGKPSPASASALARMNLDEPSGFKQHLLQRLVNHALNEGVAQ